MHSPNSRYTIACRIANARSREQISAALARSDFTLVAVPTEKPARDALAPDIDLLIDDLSPWDDAALERLLALRKRPRLPILIYYPDTAAATMLAARAALLPGVAIRRQTPLLHGEGMQIMRMVHALLAGIPGLTVRFVVDHLIPHAGPALTFMDVTIALMQQRTDHPLLVTELCAMIFMSPRALRHACHAAGVPGPKDLVEWVILLYVAASAEYYGESFARAAARLGRSGEYVRRLRVRLLPEIAALRSVTPHQLFTLTVLGFARACGLPQVRAEEVPAGGRVAASDV